MLRRLIVNADDFGFTRDVNAGILEAHRKGILTATTLMANGEAFEDAVTQAHQTPTLDVGCHLVFVQGQSVLNPSRALPSTLTQLVRHVRDLPLYEEAAAQIRRLIKAGIQPSHLDTHKHTHLLPPVLDAVVRAAREFGIPWVRRPFDFGIDRQAPVMTSALAIGIRVLRPAFRRVRSTDHFTGFQLTGRLDEAALIATLKTLPRGLTEFMCHPGQFGSGLQNAPTRLKQSRAIELAALTSPATRRAIEQLGIELTNYRAER